LFDVALLDLGAGQGGRGDGLRTSRDVVTLDRFDSRSENMLVDIGYTPPSFGE
jgi:hypothetical protein